MVHLYKLDVIECKLLYIFHVEITSLPLRYLTAFAADANFEPRDITIGPIQAKYISSTVTKTKRTLTNSPIIEICLLFMRVSTTNVTSQPVGIPSH